MNVQNLVTCNDIFVKPIDRFKSTTWMTENSRSNLMFSVIMVLLHSQLAAEANAH